MPTRFRLYLILAVVVALAGAVLAFGAHRQRMAGHGYVVRFELPQAGKRIGLPAIKGPQDPARPLVVIDAGHGGHDPGAAGADFQEKTLTLGLARALRDRLLAGGGIRVALTRDDDRFLALAERREIARALVASVFLSIHADSAGDDLNIAGATLYPLASRASDALAAQVAARENHADRINGVTLDGQSDAVSAILVELSQRRAREEAGALARLIVREGEGRLAFHPSPHRSAAFAVLKSPDVPSLLFEAGYISNPDEARRLASPEGQAGFAEAVDKAIRIYFARQAGN